MVALAVHDFGHAPVECKARVTLVKAHAALESNRLIEAGCYLREAVRQYLEAECKYWGVKPPKKRARQTTGAMAHALVAAGHLGANCSEWLADIVARGNTLAHCGSVTRKQVADAISLAHFFLDGSPYLIQPKAAGRLA